MTWRALTLGDCVTLQSGGTPSKANAAYWSGPVAWVSAKDMTTLRLQDTEDHVSVEAIGNGTRLVQKGTLLAVVRGMSLAKEFRIVEVQRPMAFNQDVKAIIPRDGVDSRFILYSLLARREYVLGIADEAAHGTKRLQTDRFLAVPVSLPNLPMQRRIASILSAYDDLIENNTRRIAILEQMARRIYEEWFVRFRFPGHEQVKRVESEPGLIPEGWQVTNLDAVSEYINRGLTPKYDELADGIVINQKCIRGQKLSYELVRRQSKPIPADKRVRYGDVLVNSTGVGTLGRVAQVLDERPDCTVDTHVTIVRPGKQVTTHFYGLSLLAREEYFEQQGVGATGQTELGRARVAGTTFIVPPLVVQEQFDELVAPMRQLTVRLTSKNANLRATRDLLLPKLISGELDVSTLSEPVREMEAAA